MKKILFYTGLFCCAIANAQEDENANTYKKRVLETSEIEFLGSYYQQKGKHSAVGGGVGTEELKDYTANIVLTIPVNDDDVLTIDAGFSAYTSASSSNINPFVSDGSFTTTNNNNTGASRGMGSSVPYTNKDDDDYYTTTTTPAPYGSPWIESTGASRKDVLKTLSASYSHSSDNRNTIWNVNSSVSKEYDYQSFGVGAGIAKLFNDKNTEVNFKASAYFDKWYAIYPTELHEYSLYGVNFQNNGYFKGVTILDEYGQQTTNYLPKSFNEFSNENRNSYSFSLGLSQVLNRNLQVSLFMDVLYQEGLLSTPYHRIYFADKANYYIGQSRYIPIYDKPGNVGVFRLSDDVERLPDTRFKIPIGARLNYYISEQFVLRSYYRYYADDWGLEAHTASIEIPYRISEHFTILPMYRFYTQKGVRYFAPFEKHYSYQRYYTSDYDLSTFDTHQYGLGLSYTDLLTGTRVLGFGLKNLDLRYNRYERSDALKADIISLAIKFVQ